jgi:hypothetical protein
VRTKTIRVHSHTHKALKQLARETGQSVQEVLAHVVQEERSRLYLEGLNADYAALRKDAKAMPEFNAETELWDITNLESLEHL